MCLTFVSPMVILDVTDRQKGYETFKESWQGCETFHLFRNPNFSKEYSNHGNLSCGVPQGSILGPLIFLLYVNDMARAVDCDLLLYADDSCLIIRDSSIEQIESILNGNFNALCDRFVENKLSIHFGEDKTKSILFSHKKCKNLEKLDIRRGDIKIKQHSKVKYLGCLLDENLSGESMETKMLGKINGKLKFLYRKQNYLDRSLRRLLLNALIQVNKGSQTRLALSYFCDPRT